MILTIESVFSKAAEFFYGNKTFYRIIVVLYIAVFTFLLIAEIYIQYIRPRKMALNRKDAFFKTWDAEKIKSEVDHVVEAYNNNDVSGVLDHLYTIKHKAMSAENFFKSNNTIPGWFSLGLIIVCLALGVAIFDW